MDTTEKLIKLYENKSKHSNYQILPTRLKGLLQDTDVHTSTRYERERLDYVLNKVDVMGKSVLDIGANTGYFSFELLDAGAGTVHYYEGNTEHAEFVRLAVDALDLQDRMKITNQYYLFDDSDKSNYDVVLLFNVLHHLGDDYGDKSLSIDKAKVRIIEQLNGMNRHASMLVYQMGFNWHGNPSTPLFENGTKAEMIEFIENGTENDWDVVGVGVAQKKDGAITYEDLSDKNIERDDSLGEFLNRPIFILKSKAV